MTVNGIEVGTANHKLFNQSLVACSSVLDRWTRILSSPYLWRVCAASYAQGVTQCRSRWRKSRSSDTATQEMGSVMASFGRRRDGAPGTVLYCS